MKHTRRPRHTDRIDPSACWDYAERINRVIANIDARLEEALDLEILAGVAAFSKFHFHRIFCALVGETAADYIMRQRLEKAAFRLTVDPRRSVTDIALECGFSNPSVFARNFKARFGMTALEWRKAKASPSGRSGAGSAAGERAGPASAVRKKAREPALSVEYLANGQRWTVEEEGNGRTVTVAAVPEMFLAYLRYVGPYQGNAALFVHLFERLFAWLGPRGLVAPPVSQTVVIYHEYSGVTPDELLRLSVCCTVPPDTAGEGEVGVMRFSPGLCAVSRFVCAAKDYQAAWDWMYETWLPGSGFMPADVPAFERYAFDAHDPSTGKTKVDICVPVAPL